MEAKKEAQANVAKGANVGEAKKALTPEQKEAKKAAAKRHAERVKEISTKRREYGLKAIEELKKLGAYDKLSAQAKEFFDLCTRTQAAQPTGNGGVFELLFGKDAKVGDKISLADAFMKSYKGKASIDSYVRKWATKGTVVEFVANDKDPVKGEYVIKAIAK